MAADEEWAVQCKNPTTRACILVNNLQKTGSFNAHSVEKFADLRGDKEAHENISSRFQSL